MLVVVLLGRDDGVFLNLDGLLIDGTGAGAGSVDGVLGRLLVVGLGTGAVTTLDGVDGGNYGLGTVLRTVLRARGMVLVVMVVVIVVIGDGDQHGCWHL
jgi:hypothetical protein